MHDTTMRNTTPDTIRYETMQSKQFNAIQPGNISNTKTMTKKYRNKYRIPSVRTPRWNYGKNAAYFTTTGILNRLPISQNIEFVEFEIIRNHFHGIVVNAKRINGRIGMSNVDGISAAVVQTQDFASLQCVKQCTIRQSRYNVIQTINVSKTKTMTEKYRNKYRILFIHTPRWNYGKNATYFTTTGILNRLPISRNIEFVEFEIIRNHFHGIVVNGKRIDNRIGISNTYGIFTAVVQTQNFASLQRPAMRKTKTFRKQKP
jgi:hypothetical protein